MDLAKELVFLVVGFYFLAKSSDWLVMGSSIVAESMGVRQLVIGLTVVAWGTSAPEVVISSLAALQDNPGVSMGNVLGSNVANIGLVLGVSALILPDVLQGRLARREAFWFLASVGVFWWAASDFAISRSDGWVLLGCVTIYNLQLLWEARQASLGSESNDHEPEGWLEAHPRFTIVLGMLTLAGAAYLTLVGAEGLAYRVGLSKPVIGLTVIAVGTSLPELAAGVMGALRGHSDISIGNVVGSNVFNVTAVVGVVALIHPFGGPDEPHMQGVLERMVEFDFPVVLGFTLVAILIPALGGARAGRLKGALLLGGFVAYTAYLLITDTGVTESATL